MNNKISEIDPGQVCVCDCLEYKAVYKKIWGIPVKNPAWVKSSNFEILVDNEQFLKKIFVWFKLKLYFKSYN